MTVSVQRPYLAGALVATALGLLLLFRAPWATSVAGDSALQASNVAINCNPGEQALVRQSIVRGELQVNVVCANSGAIVQASYGAAGNEFAQGPYLTPAVYRTQPVGERDSSVARSRTTTTQSRVERSGRSWEKTAMIIGGSTAGGAGIGGIIGGKKGALIGAAIGGGASAIYEARQRR